MSKIVIVGGGISSCVIALFLLKKKHDVEIYEKKSDLGGILNDFKINENIYFRGCQYLDVDNKWFKEFCDELKEELNIFEHTYGSYVEINGSKSLSKEFAVPFFEKIGLTNFNFSEDFNPPMISMSDRFNLYPKYIGKFFSEIIRKHKLDPDTLNFESAGSLQMSRITSKKESDQLLELKRKNKVLDEIYAVQRKKIFKEEKKLLGALPKKGFTELFKELRLKLINYGVKIYTDYKIIPKWENNKLKIYHLNKEIKNDKIIWTGDPTKLIKGRINKEIESKHIKILQTNSDINKSKNFENRYIQIFSDKKTLTKIYLYKINQIEKLSVESMYIKKPPKEILNEALNILKKFNIYLELNEKSFSQKLDLRFNLVSLNDQNVINQFLNSTKDSNLLPGAWLIYGRDRKLHFYLNNLEKNKFI